LHRTRQRFFCYIWIELEVCLIYKDLLHACPQICLQEQSYKVSFAKFMAFG
jgi:hypothetical protein